LHALFVTTRRIRQFNKNKPAIGFGKRRSFMASPRTAVGLMAETVPDQGAFHATA
jgi:hypothetical protein